MAHPLTEKLDHIGLIEKEIVVSVPQREQLASTSQSPLPKGTVSSVHSTRSRGGRVKMGERRTLVRERGIRAGA